VVNVGPVLGLDVGLVIVLVKTLVIVFHVSVVDSLHCF
jgi:hypothetical protein